MKAILKKASVFLVIVSIVVIPTLSYAHEMWYEVINGTVTKYPISWAYKNASNTMVSLECSNDLLTAPFADYYFTALASWSGSPYTICSDTSYISAKVDFVTPSTTWWNSAGFSTTALAATYNKNSAGTEFTSLSVVKATTNRTVTSSTIYINFRT
jgi:hypothetical protein